VTAAAAIAVRPNRRS